MFGLMRAKKCGMSKKEKEFRRLNYCGTCKTIGSLYGQKSRFLLNYDTVFLAEVLTALSGEKVSDWQKSYQSYNCLSLPKSEMPIGLKFAATTNIILTEFKLADHISDEGKRLHKFANRAYSKEFRIAEQLLSEWNFPLEEVKETLAEQKDLESVNSRENLDYFAEPTAETTGIFFAEGVRLIGKSDLKQIAYEIGFEFGKLIYLLDAFEDFENDFRTKQFNAIRKGFGLNESKINAQTRRKVVARFNEIENKIIEKIYKLPVDERNKEIFSSRLSDNLCRKLKTSLPVIKAKQICKPNAKPTLKQRWETSIETAKTFAKSYSWQMPFVFLFILAFALVAPAQSKEAKSARECWDLSFNLMFLGSIFGSVIAVAKPIFNEQDPGKIYPDLEEQKKKQQQELDNEAPWSDGWNDWCCCGLECGGDCCCGCCEDCSCCDCDCCDCDC